MYEVPEIFELGEVGDLTQCFPVGVGIDVCGEAWKRFPEFLETLEEEAGAES